MRFFSVSHYSALASSGIFSRTLCITALSVDSTSTFTPSVFCNSFRSTTVPTGRSPRE